MKTNRTFVLAMLALAVMSLSACENTLWGAGRDVEQAGENMQDAANGE